MSYAEVDDELDEDEIPNASVVTGGDEAVMAVEKLVTRIAGSADNDGDLTIILGRLGPGGVEKAIFDMPFVFTETPKEIAGKLVDQAEDDVMRLECPKMRYQVRFDKLKGKVAFTLRCPNRNEEDDGFDHASSAQGAMHGMVRGYAAFAKVCLDATRKTTEMVLSDNRAKERRIENLESSQVRNMRELADLLDGRQIKEIEIRKIMATEKRKDAMAAGVMQALPMIVARMTGGGGGGMAPSASNTGTSGRTDFEIQVEGLLQTFTREQFESLMAGSALTDEQKNRLIGLYQAMMDRKAAEETASGSPSETQE